MLFRFTVLLSVAALAGAVRVVTIPATAIGITNSGLVASAGCETAAILMDGDGESYNHLTLTVRPGTVGTTSTVQVTCSESDTSAGTYVPIYACSGAPTASCDIDKRVFPWSSTGFQTKWRVSKAYVKCQFTGTGTGAVAVTGAKSRQ